MPKRFTRSLVIVLLASFAPRGARAAEPAQPPWAKEIAALKQQVEEQRELIMKLTEMEERRYDYLLKLIQSMGRQGAAAPPAPPASPPLAPKAASAGAAEERARAERGPRVPTGTIRGKVALRGQGGGPIFVYVENLKTPAVRGQNVEIAQKDRGFVPAALAVQRGTRVTFPNRDPIFHNVFSPSPSQPFDLGSYRQGDKPGTVTLNTPGVVEVYCNMHAKMRASVLVVPNPHFVKAGSDGTFLLEGVPVGARRLVAWSPDARPATSMVDLTSSGAEVAFTLEAQAPAAHNNKLGKPYGSYQD